MTYYLDLACGAAQATWDEMPGWAQWTLQGIGAVVFAYVLLAAMAGWSK